MDAKKFLEKVEKELGADFYTGVPDSLLKPLSDTIYMKYGTGRENSSIRFRPHPDGVYCRMMDAFRGCCLSLPSCNYSTSPNSFK